jgi:lipopolysaccharide/colanic/teichoic acid biosynthesis glycosyltransferase
VFIGLLLGSGRIRALESRLTRLDAADAAMLATTQVALIAFAVFAMMFATLDRDMSRLFLGTFLVWTWLGLLWAHRVWPRSLARALFGQGERVPTLFVGRAKSLPTLQTWLDQRTHLGFDAAGFVWVDGGATPASRVKGYGVEVRGGTAETEPTQASAVKGYGLKVLGGETAERSAPLRRTEPVRPTSESRPARRSGPTAPSASLQAEDSVSGAVSAGAGPETFALSDLPRVLAEKSIGQVILMELPTDETVAREIIGHCQARGCRVLIQHQVDEIVGHPVVSVDEGGYHFFALHREPMEEPLNRAIKRVFDLCVALPLVAVVMPPLMAVVWIMQRREAPGPLFYVRPRSGEGRVEFPMLKFRTMRVAPVDPRAEVRQAKADDDRVYPFGRWLRRHSLDEFPQFWNVVRGDMSVVGPRPVMPLLDEEFERQVRAYRSKHWVKPGITGLAQSEGFRGEITTPDQLQERIRLDLYYIAHWSIWLDVQITFRTAGQIFFPPKSAY